MESTKEKEFYIIADLEGGELKTPVFLYEDGSSEIRCLVKFKDYRDQRLRGCYDAIKYYMELLENPARDLRGSFHLRDQHRDLPDVLEQLGQSTARSATFPVSELWQMFYKERIEISIAHALKQICAKLVRRQRKAARRNTQEDEQFLSKTGYPNSSKTCMIVQSMFQFLKRPSS